MPRYLTVPASSDKEARPDILTRRENPFLNSAPRHEPEEDKEEEVEEVRAVPNRQKDDLALRRAQSRPLPQKEGPASFVPAAMSQADMQKWERLKMTDPRCPHHTKYTTAHNTVLWMERVLLLMSDVCILNLLLNEPVDCLNNTLLFNRFSTGSSSTISFFPLHLYCYLSVPIVWSREKRGSSAKYLPVTSLAWVL